MIRFFTAHPTAANLLLLLLIMVGLSALPTLQRETFPDFSAQEVEVIVPYPGASAEDVELAICQRIEDAMDTVDSMQEVRCQALESRGVVVAKMAGGGDFSRFMDDVKTEVEAINDFPAQVEQPVIRQRNRTDQVVTIAITGPMSVTDLKAYAEQIKSKLQRQPEVSQVQVQGFSQHQLQIRVSAQRLRQYNLSISELAGAIGRQSIDLPLGNIETKDQDILIRFTDQRRTIDELKRLVVIASHDSGAEVRLGDVAEVFDRFELDEAKTIFDGQRAALLQVTKTKAEDTLIVVDAVQAFIERQRQIAPPGVTFTLTRDISSIVRDRLQMLLANGAQGLVLVFLMMWLFFRFRFALWIAVGLPASFLGGLWVMSITGVSINMLSMVALLIAVGLLMDDAIVIAENIAAHYAKTGNALTAAVEGTLQVMPGVVSSFLTTVAVFTPLAFLSGDMGKVLKFIPIVLIMVLAVSLIEAFFILPHHLKSSMNKGAGARKGAFKQRFDTFIEWLRDRVLGRAIDLAIEWRYLFLGLVLAAFFSSVGMLAGGHLKFRAFPDIEGDTIQARILLPQGTPLWRTEQVVNILTAALEKVNQELSPQQPNQQSLVQHTTVSFNQNRDANETGPHVATVSVDLLTAEERVGRLGDITQLWRDQVGTLPDLISLTFKEPALGPAGKAIDIRLSGPDLNQLKQASVELQHWLRQYSGVLDISDDLRPGKPEVRIKLRPGSLALGVDATIIAGQLRTGFFGSTVDEVQMGRESVEIDISFDASDKNSLDDLREFRVVTATGVQIPLATLVRFEEARGYARIHRINSQRTVTINGDVDAARANAQQVITDTQHQFLPGLLEQYPGIQVTLEGQISESGKTGASMARGFLFGLVAIFILLSFQFRSYIEPLVVMVAIPLSLIGVIWGHIIMGLELSMPSMMGAVSLAGIVVNNSILIVQFLKFHAAQGISIVESAKIASRERFRAILLTSLTTIVGLLPLLAEKSLQAQILIPLATSIVFGLLAATVLILLVVPTLFSVLADFGLVTVEKKVKNEANGED
ncbi:MAG: efflux RND transporter permease subunit [Pseudomonadales bacterium]|nr:efflux RND transporter permease subunit [Pseudomonadales bacterium]